MSRVQSIQRAFVILQQLASREMGITEMSESVDLPKSTVARLLKTLEIEGAVERVDGEGTYRIGPAIAQLVGASAPTIGLVAKARPHLTLLSDEIGEDAGLAVPDGYRVHYIDQVDSENAVQVRDWTDESISMHAVPSGLVMLAYWPQEALDRYLKRPLAAYTEATITDPAEIRARLQQVRSDGYAWVFEEFTDGINSVAAPILDRRARPQGALHVHGPAYRFPGARAHAEIASLVSDAARLVSGLFEEGSFG